MTEQTRINPRVAHLIDGRTLLGLLPHVDQSDLSVIRREFAMHLQGMRPQPGITWQAAWNAFTGATPHRMGAIRYRTRCKACRGRGFTHRNVSRNLSRTGTPYGCGECGGVPGRLVLTTQDARYAPIPEPAVDQAPPPAVEEGP